MSFLTRIPLWSSIVSSSEGSLLSVYPPCERGELTSTATPTGHYAFLQAPAGRLLGPLRARRGLDAEDLTRVVRAPERGAPGLTA